MLTKDKIDVILKQPQIQAECEAWLVHWLHSKYVDFVFVVTEKITAVFCQVLSRMLGHGCFDRLFFYLVLILVS